MIAALLGGGIAVFLALCVALGLRADRTRKREDDGGDGFFWFDAGDAGSDGGSCGDGGGSCGGDGGGD